MSTEDHGAARTTPTVELDCVQAGYDGRPVVDGASMYAAPSEVVLLLGHNGAGKSTILKTILGMVDHLGGEVRFTGNPLHGSVPHRIRGGIGYVPQMLGVFPGFTVEQCLELGGYSLAKKGLIKQRVRTVYDLLPRLSDKSTVTAGLLSGGEQRLLTVGMALMVEPRLLLVDEPSAGLAPSLVSEVMQQLQVLTTFEHQPAILLVEQNVQAGLSIADRAYILRQGQVAGEYRAEELAARRGYWDLL